jgi:hypothetical protein
LPEKPTQPAVTQRRMSFSSQPSGWDLRLPNVLSAVSPWRSSLGSVSPCTSLTDAALLNPPPAPTPPAELLPEALAAAWKDGVTTAAAIAAALSQKVNKILPWAAVRDAIDGALRARMLELSIDSGRWPSAWAGAAGVRLRVPTAPPPPPSGLRAYGAEAELSIAEVQNLADQVAAIQSAAAGLNLRFVVRVELTSTAQLGEEQLKKLNEALEAVSPKLKVT